MSHQDQNLCRGRSHVLKRSNHDPKSVERSWRCAIPATDKGTAFSIVSFRWHCGLYANWMKTMDVQQKDIFRKWRKETKDTGRATSPHCRDQCKTLWSVGKKKVKKYRCCLFLSFTTGRLCLTRSSLQQAPNLTDARWVWHKSRQIMPRFPDSPAKLPLDVRLCEKKMFDHIPTYKGIKRSEG